MQLDIPNIDSLADDEIRDFMRAAHKARDGFQALLQYCNSILKAREFRTAGEVRQAQEIEAGAEAFLRKLPEDWRW